jgi:hypothetical protein
MNTEIWKPVPGFEGHYEVSNQGRVRSHDFMRPIRNGGLQPCRGRIIKQFVGSHGYPAVTLNKDGIQLRGRLVHRLVALAFIPNPEQKKQVNHKDGNRLNPVASNLEWVTPSENSIHSANILKTCIPPKILGSKHHSSKLTESDIPKIRAMSGSSRIVGLAFGVSRDTIKLIRKGKVWKHV